MPNLCFMMRVKHCHIYTPYTLENLDNIVWVKHKIKIVMKWLLKLSFKNIHNTLECS